MASALLNDNLSNDIEEGHKEQVAEDATIIYEELETRILDFLDAENIHAVGIKDSCSLPRNNFEKLLMSHKGKSNN